MGELLIAIVGVVVLVHFASAGSSSTASSAPKLGDFPIPTALPGPLPANLQTLLAQGYTIDANGQLRKPASSGPLTGGAYLIAPVSSSYQTVPASTSLATGLRTVRQVRNGVVRTYMVDANGSAVTGLRVVAAPTATPTPQASPNVVGGIAGGGGTGGIPLGGALVPGVSYGTGTTVITPVY